MSDDLQPLLDALHRIEALLPQHDEQSRAWIEDVRRREEEDKKRAEAELQRQQERRLLEARATEIYRQRLWPEIERALSNNRQTKQNTVNDGRMADDERRSGADNDSAADG